MRKTILLCLFLGTILAAEAQNNTFGLTAGYLNVRGNINSDEVTFSASESGYYAGIVADIAITKSFKIQPELLYARANEAGAIFLPIMGKFYLNDKFNLQLGPQLVFSTEDVPDDFTGTEFDLAGGLGIDITSALFIEARYSFQINNSYTGDQDIKIRGNYLTLGMGYKF